MEHVIVAVGIPYYNIQELTHSPIVDIMCMVMTYSLQITLTGRVVEVA